jgi:hypothetical protein
MRFLFALVIACVASEAFAACVDWTATGKFADIEAATVVFEGVVERIAPGDLGTCAPDRVTFSVKRMWKGEPAARLTLLQDSGGRRTETLPDGRLTNRGCPTSAESDRFSTAGGRFIVFASGSPEALGAMGCGTSAPPNSRQRKRLDEWKSTANASTK